MSQLPFIATFGFEMDIRENGPQDLKDESGVPTF
jgi:hypothetical protein